MIRNAKTQAVGKRVSYLEKIKPILLEEWGTNFGWQIPNSTGNDRSKCREDFGVGGIKESCTHQVKIGKKPKMNRHFTTYFQYF